jgi:nucleolar complex protein 2
VSLPGHFCRLIVHGCFRLVSASRSHPLHFHLIRSLVHLVNHTHVYVPLSPYLLPIITSTLSSSKHKSSTLKPLDMDTTIRAPQQYLKTRVYAEAVVDEATFLLSEWLSTPVVQGSIAFPEVVVPVTVLLRKTLKSVKSAKGKGSIKEAEAVKTLVERIEESAKWIDIKRRGVAFSPAQIDAVSSWERELKVEESPLAKFVKVQRKAREKRRTLLEKVCQLSSNRLIRCSSVYHRLAKERMRYWRTSPCGLRSSKIASSVRWCYSRRRICVSDISSPVFRRRRQMSPVC